MKYLFLSIAFIIALFLQSSLVTWPLLIGSIILFCVWTGNASIFGIAFLVGIFNDLLSFHPVGASSLFFVLTAGIIFLYQRKYEIKSPIFVFIGTLLFSFLYGVVFLHNASLISAIITACMVLGVFLLSSFLIPQKSIRL